MTIGRHSQSSRPNPSTLKWGLMSSVLGLALIAGSAIGVEPVSGGIGAGDGDAQNGEGGAIDAARVLRTPQGRGDLLMTVMKPGAKFSVAFKSGTLPSPDQALKEGSSYTVSSKVIVRAASTQAVRDALQRMNENRPEGSRYEAEVIQENLAGNPGVTVLEFESVLEATQAAALMRDDQNIEHVECDVMAPRSSWGGVLDEPLAPLQWHLNNTMNPDADHNLAAVYDMGYTGAGITVGVLDFPRNAFQRIHPELSANYSASLSMNHDPNDSAFEHGTAVAGLIAAKANGTGVTGVSPNARLIALTNGSGTPILTEAMGWKNFVTHVKNHSWGAVWLPGFGTAEQVYTDPMLFPPFTVLANPGQNDLFPSSNVGLNLQAGAKNGRGQYGLVSMWATGNEGSGLTSDQLGNVLGLPSMDYLAGPFGGNILTDAIPALPSGNEVWPLASYGARTEFDARVSSRHSLGIGAVGENNQIASYSTTGTAVFASAYSLGDAGRAIVTTDKVDGLTDMDLLNPFDCGLPDPYTCGFGGTSAATPIASGIVSLILEARPDLTLRDLKHVIERTAVRLNFDPANQYFRASENPGTSFWQDNGAFFVNGRDVAHSDQYGFGLIDAEAAVNLALVWPGLPPQEVLVRMRNEDNDDALPLDIPDAEVVEIVPDVQYQTQLAPEGASTATFCVRYNYVVEEVEVILDLDGNSPGDIYVELVSPYGTVSPLHMPRIDNSAGIIGGTEAAMIETSLLTYKHWGEFSGGEWTLRFLDYRADEDLEVGEFDEDTMMPIDKFNIFPVIGGIPTLPGNPMGAEKSVLSYEVRIYGYDIGADAFNACENPQNSVCPHDIDADGIVTVLDLILFIELWESFQPIGDWDQDGDWDFFDFLLFFQTWTPGYCSFNPDPDNEEPADSRPRPGEGGDEVVRPI